MMKLVIASYHLNATHIFSITVCSFDSSEVVNIIIFNSVLASVLSCSCPLTPPVQVLNILHLSMVLVILLSI
ncbi:hypothetical protein CPJCM30710_00530 [Clostridium polyendosporum]|uniref:Uncharacterized protein n=1 Tax=Clostridium polyendosporum TaxID=69208 RepID=A0A919RVR7_9CLOT|nr:hypothetical protein CPJCM30710_00530 [Clostridium polyendosporum]